MAAVDAMAAARPAPAGLSLEDMACGFLTGCPLVMGSPRVSAPKPEMNRPETDVKEFCA
jgi:hypothetical protein